MGLVEGSSVTIKSIIYKNTVDQLIAASKCLWGKGCGINNRRMLHKFQMKNVGNSEKALKAYTVHELCWN